MKNCPQCGNVLDDSQQFCTRCGNQLATATPAQASSEPLPPPPPAGAGAPPPPPSSQPVAPLDSTTVPPPPVATPAYSPPSGPMTPPPPPANKSKWWVWLIVALVVIGLVVGLVIWISGSTRRALLESSENMKEEISEIVISPTPTPQTTVSPTPTTTPKPTVTPVPQADSETVVANFLNSSLGTLPGSRVDYNKAWSYLGDDIKALYPDGSYLPLLLCIQDGPSAVDISEPVFMDMAYVNVRANYGGSWINMWEFGLEEKDGLWQIMEISCLAQ